MECTADPFSKALDKKSAIHCSKMDITNEVDSQSKCCKYCPNKIELCFEEGLECDVCKNSVHLKCLKRGSVPGGIFGDAFYIFTCMECSEDANEHFTRMRLSWLQVIVLVLYHLQNKSLGLARKGFFHWRHHVTTFIDKNWDILFLSDFKKKKKWTGTIAGTLSHFNKYIFLSGISTFNEPAFWSLMYPRLSPLTISTVYSAMVTEKQMIKNKKETPAPDRELFYNLLCNCIKDDTFLQSFVDDNTQYLQQRINIDSDLMGVVSEEVQTVTKQKHRKRKKMKYSGSTTKKLAKFSNITSNTPERSFVFNGDSPDNDSTNSFELFKSDDPKTNENTKLLDPLCHYNTSLSNIAKVKGVSLHSKLTGGIRKEPILSPYTGIHLKPYIRRDVETFPTWLKLMAEIQLAANSSNKDYKLPPRDPIDYTYVQPEHIPAINSLCNQFFWPGIDVTETLQYPDFSCVVLYKRLIVGFAFLVPDVKHTENYMSFLFTRPCWRNCGLAKFMIYHLIQTSIEKDITLHVSMDNPALLLYQKFGFKVEHVVLGFYDKFFRNDVNESKHAFFCRLERG